MRPRQSTSLCLVVANAVYQKNKKEAEKLKNFSSPSGEEIQQWLVPSYVPMVTFLSEAIRAGVLIVADQLGTRQETRGAWIAFKKPTITSLPVLDLNRIDSSAITKLAQVYDSVANVVVQPFHEMAANPVRSRIDNAISETLNLPDISSLRVMLAREPFCSLKPL